MESTVFQFVQHEKTLGLELKELIGYVLGKF
jgi:hypothetical protein